MRCLVPFVFSVSLLATYIGCTETPSRSFRKLHNRVDSSGPKSPYSYADAAKGVSKPKTNGVQDPANSMNQAPSSGGAQSPGKGTYADVVAGKGAGDDSALNSATGSQQDPSANGAVQSNGNTNGANGVNGNKQNPNGGNVTPNGGKQTSSGSTSQSSASGTKKEWLIYPKDPKNKVELMKTEKFIKELSQSKSIESYIDRDGRLRFWEIYLTKAQSDTLKKGHPGIHIVEENIDTGVNFGENVQSHVAAEQIPKSAPGRSKRTLGYSTQINAPSELRVVSQPTNIPTINHLPNYVYEEHAGQGIFIYHIERGIAVGQAQEFPPNQVEYLQTRESVRREQSPTGDNSDISGPNDPNHLHSTCTASKTMGQTMGSAKKATLVVVKMADFSQKEQAKVFDMVRRHIEDKGRQKISVLTVSWGAEDLRTKGAGYMKDDIGILMRMNVPVVVAAGNYGNDHGRELVDTVPAIWESPTYPLIVVGATDFSGAARSYSQGGPHVTVLAPGENIHCLGLVKRGTSYAAPLVAGVLAGFLSQPTVPFATGDGQLVAHAKNFLAQTANWERKPGVRVIWNGVTQQDNQMNTPTGPSNPGRRSKRVG